MKKFFQEFREFAFQGNVLDLAVGVVIGTAFTAIVNALVESIIMPLLGIVIGGNDVNQLVFTVRSVEIRYGIFIQAILNFLIIALAIFVFTRVISTALTAFRKKADEEDETVEIPAAEQYLKEIRDLLTEQKENKF